MARDWAGRLDRLTITSSALAGNPLGDPVERPLLVYTPPGYDADPGRRYPSIYIIQGYYGALASWGNWSSFSLSFPEAVDQAMGSGRCSPALVVFPDAWTAYGGSQFVDSPGTGRYHTYLCDEVVPFVDSNYRTLAEPEHRGIQGKSSGGFGAMITPMLRPDLFGGLATHAGDALYEALYLPEFAKTVRALRRWDGDIFAWWQDFQAADPLGKAPDRTPLMALGVAACFSAADDGTPLMPFDTRTGRLIGDVWARWLDWDPVRMVSRHGDALRSQRAIWVDGGTSDEWYLDVGAEAFAAALADEGVTGVHFELFDGTHSGLGWRYVLSLRYLAEKLAA